MRIYLLFFLLLKITIIYGNEIDTLSLLTGGNTKYWDRIDSNIVNYGIAFSKDSTIEWYDKDRAIHYTCQQDEMSERCFVINNGRMYIYYRMKDRKSHIIDSLFILKITDDSLIINFNEGNDGMLIFIKSKDQNSKTKPWVNPDPRLKPGFKAPIIQDADLLTDNIESIISWLKIRGDPYPESFRVRYKILIDKNGNIQQVSNLEDPSLLNPFNYFYSLLFEKIKELRFFPAMNIYSNETYEFKWVLPINYNR